MIRLSQVQSFQKLRGNGTESMPQIHDIISPLVPSAKRVSFFPMLNTISRPSPNTTGIHGCERGILVLGKAPSTPPLSPVLVTQAQGVCLILFDFSSFPPSLFFLFVKIPLHTRKEPFYSCLGATMLGEIASESFCISVSSSSRG